MVCVSSLAACGGDDGGGSADFPLHSCADVEGTCYEVGADEEERLQEVSNSLEDGDTLILGLGVFELDNQVTTRGNQITVLGQGMGTEGSMDEGTILDFAGQTAQSNGLDHKGNNFLVADLAIMDAVKDGLRIEDSDQVTIQRVRVTWREIGSMENGAYGIYPVKVSRVLLEDSAAYNSSDAGIYVGQCRHAVVRNNIAMGNVAGIEIENTQYADVYGNHAEDNTGGLVFFDLPGNPVVGHDIKIHDNMIVNNNRDNFAPGGTVRQIPPGTGTFGLASRRVEVFNNTYENNNTVDIALLNGLAIDPDEAVWELTKTELVGDLNNTDVIDNGDTIFNYRSDNIYIHDNTHMGSGTDTSGATGNQELGILVGALFGETPVDEILYDTWGESSFSASDASMNSNDNHICLGNNAGATFVSLNLEAVLSGGSFPTLDDVFRPAAPFAPFDCGEFQNGPLADPDMAGAG